MTVAALAAPSANPDRRADPIRRPTGCAAGGGSPQSAIGSHGWLGGRAAAPHRDPQFFPTRYAGERGAVTIPKNPRRARFPAGPSGESRLRALARTPRSQLAPISRTLFRGDGLGCGGRLGAAVAGAAACCARRPAGPPRSARRLCCEGFASYVGIRQVVMGFCMSAFRGLSRLGRADGPWE